MSTATPVRFSTTIVFTEPVAMWQIIHAAYAVWGDLVSNEPESDGRVTVIRDIGCATGKTVSYRSAMPHQSIMVRHYRRDSCDHLHQQDDYYTLDIVSDPDVSNHPDVDPGKVMRFTQEFAGRLKIKLTHRS